MNKELIRSCASMESCSAKVGDGGRMSGGEDGELR
jgi:hypothetical protein